MARSVLQFLGALALVVGVLAGGAARVAAAPAGTAAAPPAADVAISPGDVITITVVGEPTLTRTVTVTADGKVPVAFVGEVPVGGLKPAEAAALIKRNLSRFLREPEVSVDLVEANRASVYGRVVRPGTYVLAAQARAMDLVQMAGGFDTGADRANMRLLRGDAVIPVDLEKFGSTGDPQFNPEVRAGDTLSVPELPRLSITVLGQVLHPGPVTAPLDATVMDAVQMAGGFTERANRERVSVLRGGGQIVVNLSRFADTGSADDNPVLKAGDSVTVPEKRMLSISVLGQVAKPSVYQVVEGTTVAEAVALAGGPLEGADLSLARVIRADKHTEPISLREALENADASANIALQDGDTVSIPKPEVERRFGVLGAVRSGGYFPMDRDRVTLTEALSRAGGPSTEANLRRAVIIHREGDQVIRQPIDLRTVLQGGTTPADQLATLGPGDVLFLEPKKETMSAGTIFGILGAITSIIYAVR